MRQDESHRSTSPDSDHLRLALLLDQMPVGIGIFDAAGELFHANGHFDRLTGGTLTRIDALAPPVWCGHARDGAPLDPADSPVARALAGAPTMPGLEFVRRLAGEPPRWTSLSAVPLQSGPSGAVTGTILVIEDIHARREEDRLRRLCETRFRNFVEHSNSAIWIADAATGRFEYASPAAVRLGVNAGATTTLAAWDAAIDEEDRAQVAEARRQVGQGRPHGLRYRRRDAAGHEARITEKSFRLPDAEADQGLIGAVLDCDEGAPLTYVITDRGEASEAVRRCTRAGYNTKIFGSIGEFRRIGDALGPGNVVVETVDRADAGTLEPLAGRMHSVLFLRDGTASASDVGLDELIERLSEIGAGQQIADAAPRAELGQRFDGLSSREQEVLDGLIRGGTNKVIAREMGISPRTVETHRAHVMQRLNARSLPDLLRIVMRRSR